MKISLYFHLLYNQPCTTNVLCPQLKNYVAERAQLCLMAVNVVNNTILHRKERQHNKLHEESPTIELL